MCARATVSISLYVSPYPMNVPGWLEKHDDVIKWKHFPRYWPFVRGIHRSPVNSPHKGQWRGALMFSLICARINDWVNNREAGDLRRRRAHYDATVKKNSMGADGMPLPTAQPSHIWWDYSDYTQDIIAALCAIEPSCLLSLNGHYPYHSIYPHPCWGDGNYSDPSLIRRVANICGHSAIYRKLNRHQTIWGAYVNKVGKTSVVRRCTLQSIGPSRIALNY